MDFVNELRSFKAHAVISYLNLEWYVLTAASNADLLALCAIPDKKEKKTEHICFSPALTQSCRICLEFILHAKSQIR